MRLLLVLFLFFAAISAPAVKNEEEQLDLADLMKPDEEVPPILAPSCGFEVEILPYQLIGESLGIVHGLDKKGAPMSVPPRTNDFEISTEKLIELGGICLCPDEEELSISVSSPTFGNGMSNAQLIIQLDSVYHWLEESNPHAEQPLRVVRLECAEVQEKEGTPCRIWVSRAFFGVGLVVLGAATACDSATMSWVGEYVTCIGLNFVIAMANPLALSAPFFIASAALKYGVPKFIRKWPKSGYRNLEMISAWE